MIISGICGRFSWNLSSWSVVEEVEDFSVSDLRRRVHSFRSRRRNMAMIKAMRTEEGKSVYPVSRYALEGARTAQTNCQDNDFIRVNQKCRPEILNWRSNDHQTWGSFPNLRYICPRSAHEP